MRSLTLFIPGLTGPAVPLYEGDLPTLPALERLLGSARRRRHDGCDYYPMIRDLMEVTVPEGRDIPVAAVTQLIDGEDHPDGVWMRADPVHLSADRDRLILLDASVFNLSQHDALAVATEVQPVLEGEGRRLEVPFRDRWYIHLPALPAITTIDLAQVAGRDINPYLPAGDEATAYHRLLNEIQMQLHDCDINRERQARGDLPVNSLWFWGVGELPDIPPRRWSVVYSDDCFLRGLGMLSMTPYRDVPAGLSALLSELDQHSDALIHLNTCGKASQYGDLTRWYGSLLDLETDWFEPALRALQGKDLDEVIVFTERYSFRVSRFALKKFWRRPKTLTRFGVRR